MPPNNQFPAQPPAAPVISGGLQQVPGSTQPVSRPTPKNPNSTQNTLLLSEIRDNMVIMADGTFRAVVACRSINFDLMSSKEREGVEFSYQNFLNSLNFPIQILIRSQRVDIGPYIDRLETIRRAQDNMLLNVLMDDYINFIDSLSQEANIMDKSFFIAIPYYPLGDLDSLKDQAKGFFGKILSKPKTSITKIDTATYEKAKTEITNRVDSVVAGLFQLGVQAVQLETKKLGELYYNVYNPDTAVREPLGDFDNITATYIKKGTSPAVEASKGGIL
jgi:type IV secretory pathway VirB4 component